MKKNQIQILQLENGIPKVKNLLDGLNSRTKIIKTIQSEEQKNISLKVKRASDHVRQFQNVQHMGKWHLR